MLDDVAAVEAAEASIEAFINRRSASQEKANELEAMYTASVRRHHAKLREQRRWEWIRHFEHMRDLHQDLADQHQSKAAALLEGAAS